MERWLQLAFLLVFAGMQYPSWRFVWQRGWKTYDLLLVAAVGAWVVAAIAWVKHL